jgi:2-keto-3-deoxy-galactonokinase
MAPLVGIEEPAKVLATEDSWGEMAMNDGIAMTWIALDWGTSRLRAWVLEGDKVGPLESEAGMGGLRPNQFEETLLSLI